MGSHGGSRAGGDGGNVAKLSTMIQSDAQGALSSLSNMLKGGSISKASFTANGNSVKSQSVTLESGGDKVEVYFSSRYEPTQVTNPTAPIKTGIYANVWKNGQPIAIRTITESKTKSVKNAKTQYENMLDVWKKATGQKQVRF